MKLQIRRPACFLARAERIVVGVNAELHNVVREPPGLAFEHGRRDDVAPDRIDIRVEHVFHFLRVDGGPLLLQSAFERMVQHEHPRLRAEPDVEQVCRVVRDDAVVARRRRERLRQGHEAGVGRPRPHPLVPSFIILAPQVYDDVEPIAQDAELVNPGLVTIENEQSLVGRHRRWCPVIRNKIVSAIMTDRIRV